MKLWKSKEIKRLGLIARPQRLFWNIDIMYEDGSVKRYERAVFAYPIGEHGSHLRIDFGGSLYHQSSFTIISLTNVRHVEGVAYKESETETK